jgi:hypothetical protein
VHATLPGTAENCVSTVATIANIWSTWSGLNIRTVLLAVRLFGTPKHQLPGTTRSWPSVPSGQEHFTPEQHNQPTNATPRSLKRQPWGTLRLSWGQIVVHLQCRHTIQWHGNRQCARRQSNFLLQQLNLPMQSSAQLEGACQPNKGAVDTEEAVVLGPI